MQWKVLKCIKLIHLSYLFLAEHAPNRADWQLPLPYSPNKSNILKNEHTFKDDGYGPRHKSQ